MESDPATGMEKGHWGEHLVSGGPCPPPRAPRLAAATFSHVVLSGEAKGPTVRLEQKHSERLISLGPQISGALDRVRMLERVAFPLEAPHWKRRPARRLAAPDTGARRGVQGPELRR